MTESIFAGYAAALWFGILTSISPCPLATNIAAVSFIGKQAGNGRSVFLNGIGYTLGRIVTYTVLGAVLVSATHAIPGVSFFLQDSMRIIIGPVLIITGVIVLGGIPLRIRRTFIPQKLQDRLGSAGWLGAFVLGMLFALALCPVSAGLFFGSTFGLAARMQSRIFIPLLYGVGTALPVIALASGIAFSAKALTHSLKRVKVFEKWSRTISGIIITGAGIYSSIQSLL